MTMICVGLSKEEDIEDIKSNPNCFCIGSCRLAKTRGKLACEKINMTGLQRKIATYHPHNKWALKGKFEYRERMKRDAPEKAICSMCENEFKPEALDDSLCYDCELNSY